jgi:hypothetical protein
MFLVVGLLVAGQTSFEMRHGSYRLRRMVTRRWLMVTQDIVRFRGNLLLCPQDLLLMNVAVTQHLFQISLGSGTETELISSRNTVSVSAHR